MKHLLCILILLVPSFIIQAQKNIDSIVAVYHNEEQEDSNRIKALDKIVWHSLFNNPDSARKLGYVLLKMSRAANDTNRISETYNKLGISHYFKSNYDSALWYYEQMIPLIESMGELKKLTSVYNNTALVYVDQADYKMALEFHEKNLSLKRDLGLEKAQASTLINIGVIHHKQLNYPLATQYLLRGLKIAEKHDIKSSVASANQSLGSIKHTLGDYKEASKRTNIALKLYLSMDRQRDMAHCYNTMGNIQSSMKNYDKALKFHQLSLAARIRINDPESIGSTLNEIALINESIEQYDTAIHYYNKALQEFKKSNYYLGMSDSYVGLGQVELKRKRWDAAINYCSQAYRLAMLTNTLSDDCHCLYQAYKGKGNFKAALKYHEQYKTIRDSLFNEANTEEVTRLEMSHEFSKQQLKDSVEFARQQEIKDFEIKNQQAQLEKDELIKYGLFGGLGLVILFSLFIGRSLMVTKTQKRLIENQKAIVDVKNKEILDSINYAKRIQDALLTTEARRLEWLKDSFIYYVPKDIVAGDFYWMQKIGNNVLVAVCDCTGHGVPGAMVSVVCFNALNRSVNEFKLKDPAKILDKTRELVKETFSESIDDVKDGMDASLISYNQTSGELTYAGALHTLYKIGHEGLEEIKGDKQPIGIHPVEVPFTSHKLSLQKGEMIYMFTDGFADQFGGPEGKKYKYKKFRAYLESIKLRPVSQQKEDLHLEFNRWKGSNEQVDDICILGILQR